MSRKLLISCLSALLLAGCGREATDVEVKLVGVGMDPDEIGPSPTAYGGVVEYNHVDFAGAGLPLGLLGLVAYDTAGPEYIGFKPPYEAVSTFSYIFDHQLRISSMSSVAPEGPPAKGTCMTVVEPSGPIGSFTTVDVGDWMEFKSEDGRGVRFNRNPAEYPTNPQDLFVYYFGVEAYNPTDKTHLAPNPDFPDDPAAMIDKVYRKNNYPFGEDVTWRFPGGFSQRHEPVGSIPVPSTSVAENTITLPDELGGLMLEWNGPMYDYTGAEVANGLNTVCMEFYEGPDRAGRETPPTMPADCATPPSLPNGEDEYDSFRGTMYTAPWETDDGLTIRWDPKDDGATVNVMVRFLSAIDYDDDNLVRPVVEYGNGKEREATVCEQADAEWRFDQTQYAQTDDDLNPIKDAEGNWVPVAGLQGDPSSRMAEVVCTLDDTGEFTLTSDLFDDALAYVGERQREAGGVIFTFTRSNRIDADIPDAKDQYDQRHEISPIQVSAAVSRFGRFWWDGSAVSGNE